ncbi:hypothetical protein PEC301899_08570 [Pectobacterium carotovorum subsp. carotovorum]|nr:hypothetical protein PEC301899_08570 [Pectobacterium carotovorum subsp. carotovorum]
MARIFISTLQLIDCQDETLVTLDLISEFIYRGWHVDVYCHRYDETIKRDIDQRYANDMLFVTDSEEHEFSENYDLLWLQYTSLNASLLNRMLNGGITANIIVDHQSLQSLEAMPADIKLENRLADKSLVTLPRLTNFLRDSGLESSIIQIFPNPVAKRHHESASSVVTSGLKKLLVIVDAWTPSLNSLSDELLSYSVSCDVISREQWLQDEKLQGYDAVLTSGRIAQYVLCSGVPVYLYRGSEFIGYICNELAENNVFREETTGKKPSAREIANDIVEGYKNAVEYAHQRIGYYKQDWCLPEGVNELLKLLPPPTLKTITYQESQCFLLHNLTLRDKVKPFYSVDKWLQERQITPARRNLLQAFIQAYPEIGNIGIVVMAQGSDEQSVLTSLASVQEQYYAASDVYVLTDSAEKYICAVANISWLSADPDIGSPLNLVVEKTSSSFLLVLSAGERLLPHALLLLAEHRLRFSSVSAFYFDEAIIQGEKADNPVLKPECNIDMLRSYPYIGRNLAFDTEAVRSLGRITSLGNGLELHDVIWQLIEQKGPLALGHIPEVLVYTQKTLFDWLYSNEVISHYQNIIQRHLARCHVDANVIIDSEDKMCRIQYQHMSKPLVSIIIPTRDHFSLISRCIETLLEQTQYPHYELLVVDNLSTDSNARQYLSQLTAMGLTNVRVLSWPHQFNFSAINNFAAERAKGDVLLFLNNDTEIIHGDWLDAMLNHALRQEVGIVGAKLTFEDGRIQHGGIVLGMNDSAAIAFQGKSSESKGYMNRLHTTHNVSAVSAACMMMRRDVFIDLGGFDEQQCPIYFGDVDLALKARQQGYLIVWTPDVKLTHLGGASRLLQQHFNTPPLPRHTDIDALYKRWLPQLVSDPCYHPAFGKCAPGFALTSEMARCQSALPGRPLPVVLGVHGDRFGCGYYRIIHPFQSMEKEMLVEGGLKDVIPGLVDLERLNPDTIIIQRATTKTMADTIHQYRQYSDAKIVVEYDDLLSNIPIKSIHRKDFSQRVMAGFRRCIDAADWVVASTQPLADELSKYHQDIRVAANRLNPEWWGSLQSQRRVSKKIRIGWAGGSSHAGDLDILRPIIKALENKVDWVFMGMKPENIKCEFHAGVPIEYYPRKMADLNLDIALVPLEINKFNECKSNLRLLELGSCGVPIICTNIEPYRCGLPVTLVDNRFKNWMDAIDMYLSDIDAAYKIGDDLRSLVYRDWMLEGNGLTDWLHAWSDK